MNNRSNERMNGIYLPLISSFDMIRGFPRCLAPRFPKLAVTITPNGRRVVSGLWDNTLKGGGLETGVLICTFNYEGRVPCAAVAPGGRTFVAGDAAGWAYFLRLEKR